MGHQVFQLDGQLGLSPLDVGFIVQIKGLLAEGRGLAVELVPRDVPFLLLVRRRVEALRHVAGLAVLPFLGRLAASPIPNSFRRWHPWRGDGMTGQTEVRFLEDIQVLRIVRDRKSTRLNSSHSQISYAVFCLKKKKERNTSPERRTPGAIHGHHKPPGTAVVSYA